MFILPHFCLAQIPVGAVLQCIYSMVFVIDYIEKKKMYKMF